MRGVLSTDLLSTHLLLSEWGKWGAGPHLGLPTRSPMFGEKALKTPLYTFEEPPPLVGAVEKAVNQLDVFRRHFLSRKYSMHWTPKEFMREYAWRSYGKFYREWEKSVRAVDRLL